MAASHIEAGVLDIDYEESGAANGTPVVLLHGFPYDAHGYDAVAPKLASAECRVIVPCLRGYGPTHFFSPDTYLLDYLVGARAFEPPPPAPHERSLRS